MKQISFMKASLLLMLLSPITVIAITISSTTTTTTTAADTSATATTTNNNNDSIDVNINNNNNNNNNKNSNKRELQALALLCSFVGTILPGDVACSCNIDVGNVNIGLALQAACIYSAPVCLLSICSAPIITISINPTTIQANGIVCFNDSTVNGSPVAVNLCINFGGTVQPNRRSTGTGGRTGGRTGGGRYGRKHNHNNNSSNSSNSSNGSGSGDRDRDSILRGTDNLRSRPQHHHVLDTCEATIDGETCSTCTPCNNGQGIVFDCNNIDSTIIQSTCHDFQLLNVLEFFDRTTTRTTTTTGSTGSDLQDSTIVDVTKKVSFLPIFDSEN